MPRLVLAQPHLVSPRPPVQTWSLFHSSLLPQLTLVWNQQVPDSMADREKNFFVHKMAPCIQACTLPSDFSHQHLLAVVDLLIDAATETHWKPPGTGPMTWTYALFFMHVVVPKKKKSTLPHSNTRHHWKHSMLCALKEKKKNLRQVHWGCLTCQRLHEIDNIFVLFSES